MPTFHLATFAADVTPPEGHPLCGGWIEPVRGVDDPLRALGVVLLGMGRPIVLCAFDWCGIRNQAYFQLRQALAEAAHTVPECVTVHCVHPHNAPFADVEAEKLIRQAPEPKSSLDLAFFDRVRRSVSEALRDSLKRTRPMTHLGIGKAKVEQVASNRRIVGPDGKVKYTRTSATKSEVIRNEPEGTIDPWLRTLSFWNEAKPLAALHYYATHPMSYYGDGRVSADFCGLARQKRQDDAPEVFQMYFTGAAGNVTAGKYNDGAKANRVILRDRIYKAMLAAWQATEKFPLTGWSWRVEPVRFPSRREASFGEEESRKVLRDPKQTTAKRNNAAFQISWRMRAAIPIDLTCLDLGQVQVLHLPGEPFVEYQLRAQQMQPRKTVCVAGYGDDGTGYIPLAESYLQGGYEPTVSLVGPESEAILMKAIAKLLQLEGQR